MSDHQELFEYLTHAEMRDRLSKCGVRQIDIFEEDDTLIDFIRIGDTNLGKPVLECIAEAVMWGLYELEFTDDEMRQAYLDAAAPFVEQVSKARSLARREELAAYFATKSELGAPPERHDNESDLKFARRIESYCGPAASGALSGSYGAFTLDPAWARANLPLVEESADAFECMKNVLEWNRLPFGIIGNEKVATETN